MWNGKKSLALSKLCIWSLMGLLIMTVATAPWLTSWYFSITRPVLQDTHSFFLVTIYVGAVPAAYLLFNLLVLLRRIQAGQVFITENVQRLRYISWSCLVGSGIALVSVFYYIPWVFLALAAAFMSLIVRVVKNVIAQAVLLQDEVDSVI